MVARTGRPNGVATAWLAGLAVGLAVAAGGCNGFWDDMTSREFWSKESWGRQPDPLEVLQTSRDGDKRHRALVELGDIDPRSLGSDETDAMMKVLADAATTERQVWARIAAVKALGNWNDPRAVEGLKDAYYRAGAFPGEAGASLRVQSLAALGRCGHPSAADILVKVLSEPPSAGSETERQQKLEERLAAARALGSYPNATGAQALVAVLRSEADPGLRRRSHESLVQMTGRQFPPEADVWEKYLADPSSAPSPTFGERLQEVLPVGWRR